METYENTNNTWDENNEHSVKGFFREHEIEIAIVLLVVLVATFFSCYNIIFPPKHTVQVTSFSWLRKIIYIENFVTQDSDWYLPEDATLLYSQEEIKRYNRTFDHYEEALVAQTREAGSFDHTITYEFGGPVDKLVPTTTLQTEYVTELIPVYNYEPLYETKYYFEISQWFITFLNEASEDNHEPYWPDENDHTDTQIEYKRGEEYMVIGIDSETKKEVFFYVDYSYWKDLKIGDKIEFETMTEHTI